MAIAQNQAWGQRVQVMEMLIKTAFPGPISALEIGVWYGLGSTKIWLENLKPNSTLMLVDPWEPYSSKEDLTEDSYDYKSMDDLSTDAYLSTFLSIKKFQSENIQKNISISTIRARAKDFLPFLKDDSFQFIYIDGDHKYENCKKDLQQAKRLVNKNFGIICGDDLEKLPTEELITVAKMNKNRDFLRQDNEHYHPGVLL